MGAYYSVFYPNVDDKDGDALEAGGSPDIMEPGSRTLL